MTVAPATPATALLTNPLREWFLSFLTDFMAFYPPLMFWPLLEAKREFCSHFENKQVRFILASQIPARGRMARV
jgi:hypothetical protein